ncbi:4Fe-4S binding protein [Chloroflexota bacterium]
MSSDDKFKISELRTSIIIMGIFWVVAIVLWQTTGKIFYIFNFGYIGTAIGVGAGLYAALPKKKKHRGRKLAQFIVGVYMLVFLGFIKFENMQIEGFFFYLLAGFFGGATIHYLVAKVVGPLFFNRGWCSWACFTAMILDYLPFPRNKQGRLPTRWGNLRYIHFVLSLGLVLILWFGFGHRVQPGGSTTELYWLIGGNALYYAVAIVLAFTLKDNRAFCKYVCPITAILKVSSRFASLKIAGDGEKCNDCGACEKICPMDIRIIDYIKNGKRVLSTECILCFVCENVCVPGALKANLGFDCGKQELLNMRESSPK